MRLDIKNIDTKKRYRVERISPIYPINAISNYRVEDYQKKKSNNYEEVEKSFHELFAESLQKLKEEEANQQPFEDEISDARNRRR